VIKVTKGNDISLQNNLIRLPYIKKCKVIMVFWNRLKKVVISN